MKLRRVWPLIAFTCVVLMQVGCSSSYSAEVRKSVQRVLKEDFRNYHFFGTPAGNFGIGTMYLKQAANPDPRNIPDGALIAIQDTYFVSTMSATEREELLRKMFPEGKLGQFSVEETLVTGVGLDVAVPNVYEAVNASGKFDFHKGVNVDLKAGMAAIRKTNWTELKRARQEGKIAADINDHLDRRDIIIVMNDIVLNGYAAKVTIDKKTNASLDAELSKRVGQVFGDASVKFKIVSGQNGVYRIEAENPVVAAVLFREIPVGVLEAEDPEKWPVAEVPGKNLSRLRDLYRSALAKIPTR